MSQVPLWVTAVSLVIIGVILIVLLFKRLNSAFHVFLKGGWGCVTGKGHKWEEMMRFDNKMNLYSIKVCSRCGLAIEGKKISDLP